MDFGGPEVLAETTADLAAPRPGEVTVDIRAAGMNPADYKHFGRGQDPKLLPMTVGSEVAGVIAALGPDTEIASGGGAAGDEVVAYRVSAGYSSALNANAEDVFAKPPALSFPEAANLLLVGTTAADALHVVGVAEGETVLIHGGAGAVGTSAVQQARLLGANVIATASERDFDALRRFGATPVEYGPGLEDRVRAAAAGGVDAAVDTVGVDEAVDVTLTAFARANEDGFRSIGATNPKSGPFRAEARTRILELAAEGKLVVPIGETFALSEARHAVQALQGPHPYGKLALIP
jgi:NADPH:quinone reductase-like Zn-dependent oxidoreductase